MTTFYSKLAGVPGGSVVMIGPSGELRRERLVEGLDQFRAGLRAPDVAVCYADPAKVARALAALDGVVGRLALLSAASPPAVVRELVVRGRFEVLLCDSPGSYDLPKASISTHAEVEELERFTGCPVPESETRWILATSGTTGEPKLVSHTLVGLSATVRAGNPGSTPPRWGLLYDHARFAGLQVLLQAVLSGSVLLAPRYDSPLDDKLAMFASSGCTHLSATPTLWRQIAASPRARELDLRQITLGGEIADDRILQALSRRFPEARISHIYASTEAGVGFSVSDRREGFPVKFLESTPSGVELRIAEGRLYVRNTWVSPAYVGSAETFGERDGWVDTGDAVEVRGDRVHFLGRANGVINVGGDKVHPEVVERVLREHPAVADVRAYGKRSAITGSLVVADVVPAGATAGNTTLPGEIRAWAARGLARHEVPAIIRIVPALAMSETGKLVRPT